MNLSGSILQNVENAVTSARRLRGLPVYRDTLTYWTELLQEARFARKGLTPTDLQTLQAAIVSLETELAERAD